MARERVCRVYAGRCYPKAEAACTLLDEVMDTSDEDENIAAGDANGSISTADRSGDAHDNDAGVSGDSGDNDGGKREGALDRGVVGDVDGGDDGGDEGESAGVREEFEGDDVQANATSAA